MYSFSEIYTILHRCKDYFELGKACEAMQIIIEDGGFTKELEQYTRQQTHVRFRQLKA